MLNNILLEPLQMGDLRLKNRICMAALTRMRCQDDQQIPGNLHVEYYSQRAAAGFILTECVNISNRTNAFPRSAGVFSKDQIEGWKRVLDAVHEKGGLLIAQVWHGGRASHSTLQEGLATWGPSPIAIRGENNWAQKPQEVPHEMTLEDIAELKSQFRIAAQNCKAAGFDGLQLHAAHGYIIDQFLKDSSNKRTDLYGGSIENRVRLCLEVIDELITVFGSGRVGIKITPVGRYNDMYDSDPAALYSYLIDQLNAKKIAFIELKDDDDPENYCEYGYKSSKSQIADVYSTFRPLYNGVLIANNNFTPTTAAEGINKGRFDAVTFGRLFIANPDLVERVRNNQPLNEKYDYKTFQGGAAAGYIDYPTYKEQVELEKKRPE